MSAYLGSLVVATRLRDRLTGFLVKRPSDCVLLISPCNSIHTFGMKFALDVAFFDSQGRVLLAKRQFPPGKVLFCKGAQGVLEKPFCAGVRWYHEGEEVKVYA